MSYNSEAYQMAFATGKFGKYEICLLYTSDAADE